MAKKQNITTPESTDQQRMVQSIPLARITIDPRQPRKNTSAAEIEELGVIEKTVEGDDQ